MLKKNSPRAGEMSVRVHQFPPLRQHRQNPQAAEGGLWIRRNTKNSSWKDSKRG